ncbi:MAG: biopolymer transporter ExbD, partial [Verrucomicrobia bacterium]|nr:biopolymer transporter ExbD [Verrucomicrobiota bacterium]
SQVQTISIDKDSIMRINNEVIDPAALESRLLTLHAEKPEAAVVVRPHKELPIQKFIEVMDILQRAGISKVGILTRPDQP